MRLLRGTARTAGAALIGFHAWLLASQWSAGRLVNDPALILRWAAALILAAALIWLGRTNTSLSFGFLNRKTIVIWLLAALLHAPSVAGRLSDSNGLQTLPEAAATLLIQTTVAAGAIGTAILALWLIAGLIGRRDNREPTWALAADSTSLLSLDDGFHLVVSARPPPSR